jgi:tricorn protease
MRDSYYDGRLNNRDWNSIRNKYEDWAARAPDDQIFATVVQLMLGELNGSHLGFSAMGSRRGRGGPPSRSEPESWTEETAHFGARFEPGYPGPGWKIRDVLPDSPADQVKSRLLPGEVILKIEGKDVSPDMDPTFLLNGRPERDIRLTVRSTGGETREVTIRPISYRRLRSLLQAKWVEDCRSITERNSGGTLGYLHVPGMNWPSFQEFEREIYAEGAGKDGLIIDVRNNGGGFTADHLLTVLCQPSHAITVGRGGEPGYPQDRRVYATWDKPVVVLCNQNSFSNAEIFSHAIKSLNRGKVVGVPTAGGVISTGGRMIMDLGYLRMPFRGWFVITDGEDMELHGAVPHYTVWPRPGEMPQGKDVQLEKAIEVLLGDVKNAKSNPAPKYRQH